MKHYEWCGGKQFPKLWGQYLLPQSTLRTIFNINSHTIYYFWIYLWNLHLVWLIRFSDVSPQGQELVCLIDVYCTAQCCLLGKCIGMEKSGGKSQMRRFLFTFLSQPYQEMKIQTLLSCHIVSYFTRIFIQFFNC